MPTSFTARRGFSLLDVLLTIGILGILTTLSIPLYRSYQARSDLNLATEQTLQGLTRAKLLSQNAEHDASWGFFVPDGVLYKGDSYAERDQAFDEVYPMPSTVTTSGSLLEVAYSKLDGRPSATGSIVLTAIDGEQRTIVIAIAVSIEGIAAAVGDTLAVCHHTGSSQETVTIVDSAWPSYQARGDTLGPCPALSSASSSAVHSSSSASSTSSVRSSSSSARSSSLSNGSSSAGGGGGASSTGDFVICHMPGTSAQQTTTIHESEWGGHQKHGDTVGVCNGGGANGTNSMCPSRFTFLTDNAILTIPTMTVSVKVLASAITYGVGGPKIPVYASYSLNDGKKWTSLFKGEEIGAGTTQTLSNVPAGSQVALQLQGYYRQKGWLTFDVTVATNDGSDHTITLRRGDSIPSFVPASARANLTSILTGLIDANGHLTIDASAVVVLTELGTVASPPPAEEDFDDAVLLMQFSPPSGTPTCP